MYLGHCYKMAKLINIIIISNNNGNANNNNKGREEERNVMNCRKKRDAIVANC